MPIFTSASGERQNLYSTLPKLNLKRCDSIGTVRTTSTQAGTDDSSGSTRTIRPRDPYDKAPAMHEQDRTNRVRQYFAGITEHTFHAELGVADTQIVDYLTDLFTRFLGAMRSTACAI